MKKIVLIIFVLLLCGCENNVNEYKEVSDIVIGLFKNANYNREKLSEYQKNLISEYLIDLENPEVNVSDFVIYNENYKTEDSNTDGIYLKDDRCYIKYNDIVFDDSEDHNSESMAKVVCNGYYVILFNDSVKPISIDYDDEKYNYRYLGYYEDAGYNFAYRSYYDGSGLIVNIDDNIEIEFTDVNDLKLKTINNFSFKNYIFPIIMLFILISFLIYLKIKNKKNNF